MEFKKPYTKKTNSDVGATEKYAPTTMRWINLHDNVLINFDRPRDFSQNRTSRTTLFVYASVFLEPPPLFLPLIGGDSNSEKLLAVFPL